MRQTVAGARSPAPLERWLPLIVVLLTTGGGFVAAARAGAAGVSRAAQIYFYGNINEPIAGGPVKNPLVVRPSALFVD